MTKKDPDFKRKAINLAGPALRALLADGNVLKTVSYSQKSVCPPAAMVFDVQNEESPAAFIGRLSRAIDQYAKQAGRLPLVVHMPGIGCFTASCPPVTGRVAGKIAVVTGAAQGFGFEISRHLANEGALVALADLNARGASAAAEQINAQFSPNRAIGVPMDVSSGTSVENALHGVIRAFGGFDILISNAGVLKAGSVKTQSEKEFQFVTDINYKGYFNCVQKAVPTLALQRLAKSDYTSDIIQINSKSGLIGSNKNGAYAGGKFGGIGLTQSFAIELVEDGIKVNAVCPGNYFDGPLWSDPKNGLFVQYLRTGKVPGAKTIEDIKRHYNSKAPMGRGCTAEDVMKAIYYLIDQQYETGQAIPVTGGQIMLH